jgi:hypothetical protein
MRSLIRTVTLLAAMSALHLIIAACTPERRAHADPDVAASEPCADGVARHAFPGLTIAELAGVHALAKTKLPDDNTRSFVYVQYPAYFHGGCAYVACGPGIEAVLFVSP